jgi:hydrogenase expression/formation protein HypC
MSEAAPVGQPTTPEAPACEAEACVTCGDRAVPVRVLELLDGGMARVDTGASVEEVSVELVEAAVGDTLLVHAGVAIGRVQP